MAQPSSRHKKNKFDNISLREIVPLTAGQSQFFESFKNNYNILATGSAGTGKSFVALFLALEKLFKGDIEKIIIVRSVVPTRDMGFLPGSLEEKIKIYEEPYIAIVNEICDNGTAYEILRKKGFIQFMSTSFLRGLTFSDCVMFIDESQSMIYHELYTTLSRVGSNCQVIISGDIAQNDLIIKKYEKSGLNDISRVVSEMSDWFDVINFTYHDIVRSDFVKQLIIASDRLNLTE